ncbi:MAG: isochorismate synthase, partial [Propionibacterium sp.]|nr:isochorismate synthase [Propionibacterium sp.]
IPSPDAPLAWLGERVRLVGWGEALRVEVRGRHAIREAAREWDSARASARVDAPEDAPVTPVAFGSFGFAWETPGFLVVPALAVVEDEGGRWIVSTANGTPAPDPLETLDAALRERAATPVEAPRGLWTETGRMTQTQWKDSVRRLIQRLRTGAASKVVMSRDMVVSAAQPVDERHLLVRLHQLYPTTWAYAVDGLIGASPEMLASMSAGTVFSRVLAGTAARREGTQLLASMKDRTEHLLAVESVARALSPIADTLDVPTEPRVIDLPNVSHLATDVTATLGAANVLDVVAALHPTAAVCGTPTKLAFDLLESFESTRRGRYSGPVGWIDASGEGEFAIALRCGQVSPDRLSVRVFAGGGIMPDSVPEVELAETRAKMAPVLEALGVPASS